jgi:FkbM family methyltransferase
LSSKRKVGSLISIEMFLTRAKLRFLLFQLYDFLIGFASIIKTTENWWTAVALYLNLIKTGCLRIRGTEISFSLTKDGWTRYILFREILSSETIEYVGGRKFRFSHPKGLEFDCDDDLSFFANASKMHCYQRENDILCEINDLEFMVPFPHGTLELKEVFVNKTYGKIKCEDAVVVDVGAFIGDSSIFFARNGAKTVVAFEPTPPLFAILRKNVALNGYERVIYTKNEAISDFYGVTKIRYNPDVPGSSSVTLSEGSHVFTVPSIPLSAVINDLGKVDLLKMDCEGCEYKALREARKGNVLKHVRMIILEVHHEVRSLLHLLQNEGFKLKEVQRLPPDCWIVSAQRD